MSGMALLTALKAFDTTVRCGSVSAAARELGLRQPTISMHIARLEREYGVELFYRRGRRLVLTPFGEALRQDTQRVFRAENDAHALLAAVKNKYAGRLSVHAIGPYNVVPIIRHFRGRYPLVQITVAIGHSQHIVQSITDYRHDVGIVVHEVDEPHLFCLPFRRQPLVVFAPLSHRLARRSSIRLEDLAGEQMVLREHGSTTRRVFEQALQERGIPTHLSIEMGSREAVREAVAQGLGLGVVAGTAYIDDARLVRLPLEDCDLATHCHVICRADRRQTPLIAAFLSAAEAVRDSPGAARRQSVAEFSKFRQSDQS